MHITRLGSMKGFNVVLFLWSIIFSGCTKMNDIQQKYVEKGLKTYTAKVDSVIGYSGHHRIKLSFLLPADPKITGLKIFWNEGQDSIVKNVPKVVKTDTVSLVINNLTEGAYRFTIYTFGDKGNYSIPVYARGISYGQQFRNALLGRAYEGLARDGDTLVITWGRPEGLSVKTEVAYEDDFGQVQNIIAPESMGQSKLTAFPYGGSFVTTTWFLPDSTAIDTFKVKDTIGIPVKVQELNKNAWEVVELPSDLQDPVSPLTNLFDSNFDSFGQSERGDLPQSFTVDLGASYELTRMKLFERGPIKSRAFAYLNPKHYNIWGSNTLSDDWKDWTLIKKCESVKPSGLPYKETTSEDIAYMEKGEENVFPVDMPSFRYIRFQVIDTWVGTNHFYFAEFSLWGYGEDLN